MIKKIGKPFTLAALLCCVLGQPANAGMVEGEITIWIGKGAEQMKQIAAQFSADTGVVVNVESPVDSTKQFEIQAGAGDGPDIYFWPHDRMGDWARGGLISEIKPSPELRASAIDYAWDAVTVDGRVYGYPIAIEAISLIYNKALIDTPPASFEEMFALDKKLMAEKGVNAILWDYNNTYYTWPLLAANGGYVFARKDSGYDVKDTGVNKPGAKVGAKLLKRMLDEGLMPRNSDYSIMEMKFKKQEIAMMLNGPWYWDDLQKEGIDFGVTPLPTVDGHPAKPFVGVWAAMINLASPNALLVKELLNNYLMTEENQRLLYTSGELGAMANKNLQKELEKDPMVQAVYASAAMGEPMPNAAAMGRFWSSMGTIISNITTGRQQVDKALDTAAKRIIR
ncbi:maltose/maltodextrin ABC transporter substrate-binding protein MalE [Corallincola spongiicola]|uniref:Maltodextrin-binding protein n=1 Tax=Corallincola spongiicola TaxID=2520508 RepID=A0ABY1WQE4_9GAMM|nr:maltose/maltodextrin ABC transporter substrate-binding protein MalE [Corallincola spongiicola]TAA46937.1 maltose/maltodextrin ABC transporter substrate-binding protein MalE [Corallincola spongiicola]